jgi:hypothetical protein
MRDCSFGLLGRLPVELMDTPEDITRAWDLARRYDQHPCYDVAVATAEGVHRDAHSTAS